MLKKVLIISMVLMFGAVAIFAHDFTGREVVGSGELVRIEGELRYDEPVWYLDSEKESYLLHLGPKSYLESKKIPMEDGKSVSVEGFRYEDDIAVVSVAADGKEYALRDTEGFPFWAGRGKRHSKNGGHGLMCRVPRSRWEGDPEYGRFRMGPNGFQRRWDGPGNRHMCW